MLKVAIVVHRFPQLSETFIINQITALIDAGVDVQIFSYYKPDPSQKLHPQFIDYALEEKVHYGIYLPTDRISKYKNFVELILKVASGKYRNEAINALNYFKFGKSVLNLQLFYRAFLFNKLYKFDIIHCHFGPIGHDIVQLRRMGIVKGKVITSFHGYDFQRRDILRKYQNYKTLFKFGDGFVANSTFTKDRLIVLGCKEAKLRIIPVSAYSKLFNLLPKRLHKYDSKLRILTVARLEEVKGIEYAIRAMSLLKNKSRIDFVYTIIGSGTLEVELKRLVNDLNLCNVIHFLGSKTQDDVVNTLVNSDVFLLPSVTTKEGASEAQGLVLLEAQAVGLPVVASNSGGIPDCFLEGKTGYVVQERNSDEIADALIKFSKNPDDVLVMGNAAVNFVKENFSQTVLCNKLVSFYKNLSENHKISILDD